MNKNIGTTKEHICYSCMLKTKNFYVINRETERRKQYCEECYKKFTPKEREKNVLRNTMSALKNIDVDGI